MIKHFGIGYTVAIDYKQGNVIIYRFGKEVCRLESKEDFKVQSIQKIRWRRGSKYAPLLIVVLENHTVQGYTFSLAAQKMVHTGELDSHYI